MKKNLKTRIMFMLIAVFGITVLLSGCVKKIEKGSLGKSYEYDGIEYTINNVYVSDVIDGWEGANDDMLLPVDENNCNVGVRYSLEEYKAKYGMVSSDSDNALVTISFSAKNVSKEDITLKRSARVNYDDGYKYESFMMVCRQTEDGVWSDVSDGLTLKKLKENSYEFREVVEVPKVALENDKSVKLYKYGVEFDLRDFIK